MHEALDIPHSQNARTDRLRPVSPTLYDGSQLRAATIASGHYGTSHSRIATCVPAKRRRTISPRMLKISTPRPRLPCVAEYAPCLVAKRYRTTQHRRPSPSQKNDSPPKVKPWTIDYCQARSLVSPGVSSRRGGRLPRTRSAQEAHRRTGRAASTSNGTSPSPLRRNSASLV